jgi:very-short-patch-repair endonuclease
VAKSVPVETDSLCQHGCGCQAKYQTRSGSLICHPSSNTCPAIREKNSKGLKEAYRSGRRMSAKELYLSLDDETKARKSWNKGLTKHDHDSIKAYSDKLKGRQPFLGKSHSEETKRIISRKRSEWLKKSENRVNLGRHKKSWMESTFEAYLMENGIADFVTEKHFWSEPLRKNFYTDFLFESHKLVVELDGTQHLATIDKDAARDAWFSSIGYNVIRVDVYEFKRRLFSGQGFLDILGC